MAAIRSVLTLILFFFPLSEISEGTFPMRTKVGKMPCLYGCYNRFKVRLFFMSTASTILAGQCAYLKHRGTRGTGDKEPSWYLWEKIIFYLKNQGNQRMIVVVMHICLHILLCFVVFSFCCQAGCIGFDSGAGQEFTKLWRTKKRKNYQDY